MAAQQTHCPTCGLGLVVGGYCNNSKCLASPSWSLGGNRQTVRRAKPQQRRADVTSRQKKQKSGPSWKQVALVWIGVAVFILYLNS